MTFYKLLQTIVQILDTLRFRVPLAATYAVRLKLIGKLVVDFLFLLLELFSLGVMAEALYERTLIRNRLFWRGLISFGQIFT